MVNPAELSTPDEGEFLEEPASPGPYSAGDLICGKYRLIELIGFGGMGAVWRAHNEILDVSVALKLIRHDLHWSSSSERLLVEARAAAALRHSSIVRVYDFGKTRHRDPFIAMELLQGESLRDRLDRENGLPAIEAVRILLPILGGIACAHARGIIHRDLKPENIFLARNDAGDVEPKVLDFGIAKRIGVPHRTTGNILLGSPEYISPEQALGTLEIDQRVDVWAASVVLYETIAGYPPWESASCPALLRAIVDDPPFSLLGNREVDVELWAILERGLAKDRDLRWSSARELGHALAAWLMVRGVAEDISGASLRVAWATGANAPPSSTADAAVALTFETKSANGTPWSASKVLGSRVDRWRMPLAIAATATAMLAAAFGYRAWPSVPATAQPAMATPAQPASVQVAIREQPDLRGELDAGFATSVIGTDAPSAMPRTERARPVRSAHTRPTSPAAPAAPPPAPALPKGSARDMDFGF